MWTVGTLCREKLSPPASTTRSLGTSVVSTLHDAYNPGGFHYQCPQETPVPDKAAQTNSKLKTLQIEVLAWDSACTLCITRSSKKQRDHWTLFLFSPKLLPSRNIYVIIIIIIIIIISLNFPHFPEGWIFLLPRLYLPSTWAKLTALEWTLHHSEWTNGLIQIVQ